MSRMTRGGDEKEEEEEEERRPVQKTLGMGNAWRTLADVEFQGVFVFISH